MADMREFAFKHALTRDVAYASLPRTERREIHRRVAEWVQDVAPDRGVEAAELAAHHYAEAIGYGEDDPAVARRACELLLRAGEASRQRGALSVAAAQLERALDLAADDGARAAVHFALALVEVSSASGTLEVTLRRALARLEQALQLADPGDAALRADVLGWRSRVLWLLGEWDASLEAADAAVSVLRGLPESPQLARVLARRSQLAMLRDDDDAERLGREALAVATRVDDRFATVVARINVATVASLHGAAPDAVETLEIVDMARAIGAGEEAFRAFVNFVWSAPGNVSVDEVERISDLARDRLAGVPAPGGMSSYMNISLAALHLVPAGRWAEVSELLDPIDPDGLTPTNRIPWLGVTAQLAVRRGDLETAGAYVREQHDLAVVSRETQRIIPMACSFLAWAAAAGERDLLRDVAREVLELVGGRWSTVLTLLPAVRALAAAGELDLLRAWLASAEHARARGPGGRLPSDLEAARGLLALGEGRPDDAAERLERAATANRSLGYAFDAAALELDLAGALEARGESARAAALRLQAEAFMHAIGCAKPL